MIKNIIKFIYYQKFQNHLFIFILDQMRLPIIFKSFTLY